MTMLVTTPLASLSSYHAVNPQALCLPLSPPQARIGHFVEAQVLQAIGVDYIDESEVLTPADDVNHIDKHKFNVPYVCGCR